jgi:hypothetical protein
MSLHLDLIVLTLEEIINLENCCSSVAHMVFSVYWDRNAIQGLVARILVDDDDVFQNRCATIRCWRVEVNTDTACICIYETRLLGCSWRSSSQKISHG